MLCLLPKFSMIENKIAGSRSISYEKQSNIAPKHRRGFFTKTQLQKKDLTFLLT